jgi:putative ATP-dependent endonuclease of the OLD family
MKIRRLIVKNFRGIKELEWCLPSGNIFCLIGKGDSTKSTILDAIRYAFYPRWNLSLHDADFYQCNTANSITIEVTLGALVEEFCSLKRYGQYLRGWESSTSTLLDEPDDHLESVLTVRLIVEQDLEPKWFVICDRNSEGVEFKTADRNKVSVGLIGAYSEKQLSWANGTALAKITNMPNLNEALIGASRTARTSLDANRENSLCDFDEAAEKSETVAKQLGVPVRGKYKAHLDLNSIDIKVGGLALHDDEMPLRRLGLGSRRMLLCGIQKLGIEEEHITLLDEIEFGLEPHRISRLIKHLQEDATGQYYLTTHSPIVLRELTIKELYIVHNVDGLIKIVPAFHESLREQNIQGKIRSSAEAFLSKKVVVCEGATEVGFLRGFDDFQVGRGEDPFSYHGVALLDAHGADRIKGMAQGFNSLLYSVAILVDGDAPEKFSEDDEAELLKYGVEVAMWAEKLSLEERAMMDLPWLSVLASIKLASERLGYPVRDNVCSALGSPVDNIDNWVESINLRQAIGRAAKKTGWFKDITRGEMWFKTIAPAFDNDEFQRSDLASKLQKLWEWAEDV